MSEHPSRLAQGRTAEIRPWGDHQVLKLFWGSRPGEAEHEARIARLAQAAGLSTPQVYDVVQVEGRAGIIYERITGPSMLAVMAAQPWRLLSLAYAFAELQASLHRTPVPDLRTVRQALQHSIQDNPTLAFALREVALTTLVRLPDGNQLCHGDFHPDNIILSPHGPVIIDWPNAVCGCALADVARTSLMLRFGALPPGPMPLKRLAIEALRQAFHAAYLRRYFQISSLDRAQLAAWEVPVAAARLREGIPGEEEHLVKLMLAYPAGHSSPPATP